MKNKQTIKKILIGLVIAVALLVVYSLVAAPNEGGQGSNSLSSLLDTSSFGQIQETETNLANAEILRILGSIKSIQLNDGIFSNPVFHELKDAQFNIPKPVRVGRNNPFLPIGFDAISQAPVGNGSESSIIPELGGETEGGVEVSGFFDQ